MLTEITKINTDWTDVKNECRNTVNKEATDKPATERFKKQLLLSEHSPITLLRVKWKWRDIPSWVSVHFARHWLGWQKWISTQRTDRTGVDRNKAPQDTPVVYDGEANAMALINVARKRLCYQASTETRGYMEDLKVSIGENGEKEISNVLVPNCIYRMGCPEFGKCGHIDGFIKFVKNKGVDISELFDIQTRYDLWNEWFYSKRD
jgi:hypothetical protein